MLAGMSILSYPMYIMKPDVYPAAFRHYHIIYKPSRGSGPSSTGYIKLLGGCPCTPTATFLSGVKTSLKLLCKVSVTSLISQTVVSFCLVIIITEVQIGCQ